MPQLAFVNAVAEVTANPSLRIPLTGKSIVAARKAGLLRSGWSIGLRWERVAAYAGITDWDGGNAIRVVQELWEKATGLPYTESYTGHGPNFSQLGRARSAARKVANKGRSALLTEIDRHLNEIRELVLLLEQG